jgi:hypothetical protein
MTLANIWPQSAPFQALKRRRHAYDHEFVITHCGNLVSGKTYWLQGQRGPNGWAIA